MKVVITSWRDLANSQAGGSEVLVDQLLTGLSDRGHDVALACGGPIGERPYPVLNTGGTFSQYLRTPFLVRKYQGDADILIDVENGIPFFSPLWWFKPSVCLVHHIHSDQWSDRFSRPVAAVARFVERRIMPLIYRNKMFIAISQSTHDALIALGVPPKRIRIIETGVEPVMLLGAERSPTPLYAAVGRLVPHKRTEILIQAFLQIQKETRGRLVIAGDGPEYDRISRLIGDESTIDLVGKISDERKQLLLESAWFLVTATHHEGWGITVLEAASVGTPTLAFNVTGIRDSVIEGVTGFLVEEGVDNVADFASAWLSVTQNKEGLENMSIAAAERAASFTWSRMVDQWEGILSNLTRGR